MHFDDNQIMDFLRRLIDPNRGKDAMDFREKLQELLDNIEDSTLKDEKAEKDEAPVEEDSTLDLSTVFTSDEINELKEQYGDAWEEEAMKMLNEDSDGVEPADITGDGDKEDGVSIDIEPIDINNDDKADGFKIDAEAKKSKNSLKALGIKPDSLRSKW